MSVLLYLVGTIAVVAGAAMVAFGIPINEFSFGNTLIAAGVTTFMGGLVILGLGAVVAQLQRVVDALVTRPAPRPARPMEAFDAPVPAAAASRIPFPSKPKSELHEPLTADSVAEMSHDAAADDLIAPMLHNPDEPSPAVEGNEEFPPSRRTAAWALGANGSGAEKRPQPPLDGGWRAPPPLPPLRQQAGFFENMWPAPETRQVKAPPPEPKYEAKSETKFEPKYESKYEAKPEPGIESMPDFGSEAPVPDSEPPVNRAEPERAKSPPIIGTRAVAILKSGVVDGMGYTLYVDGSIEAELPQGTLRFASINELRSHLEKNS
jgi:hypothetical protein